MRAVAALAALAAGGLAACSPPTPPVSSGTSPAPLSTAAAASGDRRLTISPAMYGAGDPCAAVTRTEPLPLAPLACQQVWYGYGTAYIPGQDVLDSLPMTHQVSVAAAVDTGTASAAATAFFREQALSWWAITRGSAAMLEAMSTGDVLDRDGPYQALKAGANIGAVPACMQATWMRVATLDAGARDYVNAQGFAGTATLAVLATFPACPGIKVGYQNGTSRTLFTQASPTTGVYPGKVVEVPGIGAVWQFDGIAYCGAAELRSVCGS